MDKNSKTELSKQAGSAPPRRRRWKLWGGVAAVVAMAGALALGAFGRFGVEHAKYDVVEHREQFEVRRYAPRILAEVTVEADDANEATNEGFRVLAGYIFRKGATVEVEQGGASEAIAMTTPVDRVGRDGKWTVRFTMPSKYRLQDLPPLTNPRIRLTEVAAQRFAVVRFSGAPNEEFVDTRMRQLASDLDRAGFDRIDREPIYARYDPPWTPSFLRRNEVLIEIGGGAG